MKYEMQTEAPAKQGPRPTLDPGSYQCRIIHVERVEYKERLDEQNNKLVNAGLKFHLVPMDEKHTDVRIRDSVHVWSYLEDTRQKSEAVLRMIFDFAGKPLKSKAWDDQDLIGCRIGVKVDRAFRFADNGDRIDFNEIKRWIPGPDHNRQQPQPQQQQQQQQQAQTTPTTEVNAPGQNKTLDRFFS